MREVEGERRMTDSNERQGEERDVLKQGSHHRPVRPEGRRACTLQLYGLKRQTARPSSGFLFEKALPRRGDGGVSFAATSRAFAPSSTNLLCHRVMFCDDDRVFSPQNRVHVRRKAIMGPWNIIPESSCPRHSI